MPLHCQSVEDSDHPNKKIEQIIQKASTIGCGLLQQRQKSEKIKKKKMTLTND